MRKKRLPIVLAMACVIACAFGLVACDVQVTKVTLSSQALGMTVGDQVRLTARVEPSNATDKSIIWESSNPSVATVDGSGTVTALSDGSATIYAYAVGKKHWDICNVTVNAGYVAPEAEVEDIRIQTGYHHQSTDDLPINIMMTAGDSDILYGQIFFSVTGETELNWSAEPADIVEVSAIGSYEPNYGNPEIHASIRALKSGDATVTVSAGGKSASCKVRVVEEKFLKQLEFSFDSEDRNFTVSRLSEVDTEEPIDIVIPSEVFGLPVVGIQGEAFSGANNIKSVEIQNGVTYIGSRAFENCQNLESVSLGSGVKKIEYRAFGGCSKLETINIPDGIEEIGYSVFSDCRLLTIESLTCSTSILNMLPTSNLRELTVTGGDTLDFLDYPSLQKLTFGGSIKTIEDVGYLSSQTEIHYNGTLADWCETEGIGKMFFITENENSSIAWTETELADGVLVIPEGVTKIENWAFRCFDNIVGVTLPASVNSIGQIAFSGEVLNACVLNYLGDVKGWCEIDGLENLVLPYSEIQIKVGGNSLSGDIVIPEGTARIGSHAFALSSITGVSIPSTVKTIEEGAFSGSDITALTIPEGVERVGELNNLNITTLSLPATLQEEIRVYGCGSLQDIQFAEGFDFDLISLSGCPYEGDEKNNAYYLGTKLVRVKHDAEMLIIPSNCTAIADDAFQFVPNLKYLYVEQGGYSLIRNVRFSCPNLTVFGDIPDGIQGVKTYYRCPDSKCTDDGWIYNVDRQYYDYAYLIAYIGAGGEVTVPAKIDGTSVKNIPYDNLNVFLRREDITKLILTASITVNGDAIFCMPNLTEIELAETVGVFTINIPLFTSCDELTGISIAGGYQNYKITMKENPTAETVTVTPTDAANTLSYIKDRTYKLFTIEKKMS